MRYEIRQGWNTLYSSNSKVDIKRFLREMDSLDDITVKVADSTENDKWIGRTEISYTYAGYIIPAAEFLAE